MAKSGNEKEDNGKKVLLTRITPSEVGLELKDPVDEAALVEAKAIFVELRKEGSGKVDCAKLVEVAKRLGDIANEEWTVSREECRAAYESLPEEQQASLQRMCGRVRAFAEAQRSTLTDLTTAIPGGEAGHVVRPCRTAGCYAPGGRYPLPSSVIMTAVTARAAGCHTVVLASPHPKPITLAAAFLANVDIFIKLGGAQAIATMAYGTHTQVPPCQVIVGPGNKWVTAAKSIVQGYCRIDMLAGPSEVLVICDASADPHIVASDLIAQAEHDVVARAILLSTDEHIIHEVEQSIQRQLALLPEPNQTTARQAFETQSFAVLCKDLHECIHISNDIAPEHLEIQTLNATEVGQRCVNYGGIFIGSNAAEVFGDYGAGPNHTLPTGGTGRYTGGLSVFDFLKIQTWMRMDDEEDDHHRQEMIQDSIVMARLEGLEGHARAAEIRKKPSTTDAQENGSKDE